jgi:response regulator RpfG family c-di-GMP phosphodiesterase
MPLPSQKAQPNVGEILLRAGVLPADQVAQAMARAAQERSRPEETFIDLGLVTEAVLLKALAAHFQTQFVSSEKLAKAAIDKPTLAMIPREAAEALGVFPVMFDAKTSTLAIVTTNPSDTDALRNVQLTSQAKHVRAFIARPRAIRSAIARAYGGEQSAFAWMDLDAQGALYGFETTSRGQRFHEVKRAEPARPPTQPPPAGAFEIEHASPRMQHVPAPVITHAVSPAAPAIVLPGRARTDPSGTVMYAFDEVLEFMNVFVSLLENDRPDLRGHSAQVARLTRKVSEKMAVPGKILPSYVAAAYTHDLGKAGQYHLTALNVSEYEGHKVAAQGLVRTPSRMLEAVKLPAETSQGLVHMYERFDGRGLPDGLAGRQIPLSARILAATDTYADLTQNPRNPFRKSLPPGEAFEVLNKFKGIIFDPDVVDVFQSIVLGEDLKARLLADRYTALLIDPDSAETSVLEIRMIDQGFDVKIARSAEQAREILGDSKIDLVVSEIDLPGEDGLTLLASARQESWGKDVAWVMHTKRQGRTEAQKAFEHGVIDFVSKPTAVDVLVAKLKARLDRSRSQKGQQGGLSGSLAELGLPDLVTALSNGRKTGVLKITSKTVSGEVQFLEGAVVNAQTAKKRGTGAFFELLALTEGQFTVDPTFKPKERLITESTEALLLEGMRRLDEGV